ncbi:DUF6794 domain-containing protein [Laspinema olomoucense]|uniref:DUF6794 domain-containing protein n=1 Tax=Laspinema olomoucense TaxID=3231600 RepID=UPI0021BA65A0|nr:DUF6794 domain-containing protein [Laspinema sp. D3d]MCT7971236.1 hypothetical protein [Laspinema sp. D3d]
MNMDLPIEVTPAPADPKTQINPTYSPETGLFVPSSIEEAIAELEKMLHPEFIEDARAMSQLEFLNSQHFSLAMWIRNEWTLWGINPLTQSLRIQGITHPDEMSSFLLGQFWQHLQQHSTDD